jgi:hypothetical protein
MVEDTTRKSFAQGALTIEEVNRVLEIGRLLHSVLTPEEIESLYYLLNNQKTFQASGCNRETEIGNTGVT